MEDEPKTTVADEVMEDEDNVTPVHDEDLPPRPVWLVRGPGPVVMGALKKGGPSAVVLGIDELGA